MTKRFLTFLAGLTGLLLGILPAQAALVMPSFDNAPVGWVTDRYDPHSFGDIGTYQGRNDVLAIGISEADGLSNRPAAYQSTFYNTQGRQHAISGGAGSVLSAALWIPEEWANTQNGHVRTDMWGVMTDGTGVSDYPPSSASPTTVTAARASASGKAQRGWTSAWPSTTTPGPISRSLSLAQPTSTG